MSQPTPSSQPWSLAGKTAIVTGGSRGIGRGIALHLARKGVANIAITYVTNKEAAEKTLQACRELGAQRAHMIRADVREPGVGQRIIDEALSGLETETLDILVNNAILADPEKAMKTMAELTEDDFDATMHANVFTAVKLMVAFLAHVPASGGRVINISSIAAKRANWEIVMTYGASKAALESFTKSFALEFAADKGVTFNSVSVGPVATESLQIARGTLPESFNRDLLDSTLKRIAEVEDVAYIVGFLASEEGRWVNGASVPAHGGHKAVLSTS
jgi:3-oxoacyl-[acyl-carrier protein] reductase